jgi:hypothetical protein
VLTLDYCKKVLNKGARKYSEEDIKEIRAYLYCIGQLEMETNTNKINKHECYTVLQS